MKIVINGQLIEYKDEGAGPVLLLMHGWGMDLTTFDNMTSYLEKKFRVIRFDFPGFGQSPKPDDDWLIADYARLTRDLLKKLRVDRMHAVIGHSFGGRVIIKGITLKYLFPDRVVLIDAAGIKPHQEIKKSIYKSIAKLGKLATSLPMVNMIQTGLRRRLYASVGNTDYLEADKMQKIFVNIVNEDLTSELSNISCPTLLLWGKDDTETPLTDAKLMAKLIPNGQLIVIPDAGHFVYMEALEKVVTELDRFLK